MVVWKRNASGIAHAALGDAVLLVSPGWSGGAKPWSWQVKVVNWDLAANRRSTTERSGVAATKEEAMLAAEAAI